MSLNVEISLILFSKISFSRSVFTKQFSVIDVLLKLKLKHNSYKQIISLCVGNFEQIFIVFGQVNMSIAILPMSAEFNWNPATVGLIQSSFFWGYLLTQVFSSSFFMIMNLWYTGIQLWVYWTYLQVYY